MADSDASPQNAAPGASDRIIILGAGRIGGALAVTLAEEKYRSITLVDARPERLKPFEKRGDLNTLCGNGAHSDILEKADIENADMLVALTESDEVNIAACHIAKRIHRTPKCIARVRATEHMSFDVETTTERLRLNHLISPEQRAASSLRNLLLRPGVLQVLDFANGCVRMAAVRIEPGAPASGRDLRELYDSLPQTQLHVGAVYRRDEQGTLQALPLEDNLRLKARDEVFAFAGMEDVDAVVRQLRTQIKPVRHLFIAGGSFVGHSLAKLMRDKCSVKIIDSDPKRAEYLSQNLGSDTVVLCGDIADENLLKDENLPEMDAFCALTNSDELNIVAAMQAKRQGVFTTVAMINRRTHVDLIEDVGEHMIDIVVSPQQAALNELLVHIRRGPVRAAYSLRSGSAEALEFEADESSQAAGKTIAKLNLPGSVAIGAVVRNERPITYDAQTTLQGGDRVILFCTRKRDVRDVERLFQVDYSF